MSGEREWAAKYSTWTLYHGMHMQSTSVKSHLISRHLVHVLHTLTLASHVEQ
jgi:hypothetical protein